MHNKIMGLQWLNQVFYFEIHDLFLFINIFVEG